MLQQMTVVDEHAHNAAIPEIYPQPKARIGETSAMNAGRVYSATMWTRASCDRFASQKYITEGKFISV
jgi:hypothetical protein